MLAHLIVLVVDDGDLVVQILKDLLQLRFLLAGTDQSACNAVQSRTVTLPRDLGTDV